MKQEKALKEQVDDARHKEAILQVHLQLWIDEVYVVTTSIEEKLTQLQETQEKVQGSSSTTMVFEQQVEEVQQATTYCTADLAAIQAELGGIRTKISTPVE